MPASGNSRANENRRIRQEALREQLSQGKHVEHVIEISNTLLDLTEDLDSLQIQRLKAAADIKKGLIAKYLPDMKMIDVDVVGSVSVTYNPVIKRFDGSMDEDVDA